MPFCYFIFSEKLIASGDNLSFKAFAVQTRTSLAGSVAPSCDGTDIIDFIPGLATRFVKLIQ